MLTRWPMLEPVIDRWWNNVSFQCRSRDCERSARLYNVTVACTYTWFVFKSACNGLRHRRSQGGPKGPWPLQNL